MRTHVHEDHSDLARFIVAPDCMMSDSDELEVKLIDFSLLSFFGVKVSRTRIFV